MESIAPPLGLDNRMVKVRFPQYAWGLLGYNLLVVLWGAFVRASRSGDGCGSHWPSCNGEITLLPDNTKAIIENSHRLMSGLDGLLILGLAFWAFRAYGKGHPVRSGVILALFFTATEALIGRQLVLYKLVGQNSSPERAIWMSLHLANTFVLLAWLTLTAWWASSGRNLRLQGQGAVVWAWGLGLLSTIILAVSGAVAALGDTLFPAKNLLEGIQQDFSPTAHILIQLRVMHPLIAISVALYLVLLGGLLGHLRPAPETQRAARWLNGWLAVEMVAGLVNVLLLAPIWMQLVHLLLANLLWITLVLMGVSALSEGVPQVEMGESRVRLGDGEQPSVFAPQVVGLDLGAATWKDYVALTKPRVISLLLFTTMTAMVMAAGGWPGLVLFVATSLGLYMAAGAANAINMVLERDLDIRMERTATRPTVTHKIPPRDALWFAFALEVGSFALLWGAANLLAAMLALAGLVVYVIIYTLLLKRRTWSNIVIGGAAGAFPPLVGWAAVDGNLTPLAWCLFALVFVWTPVHFWALAILIKDDYAKAGVPMLPVVKGLRNTVLQIGFYAFLTVAVSIVPLALHHQGQGALGWLYLGSAAVLNSVLIMRSFQLYQRPERRQASSLFHYSMLYLALLFLALAVDRTSWV